MQTSLQINPVKERLIFLAPTVQERLERECNIGDFDLIAPLGSGAFGKVFKAKHKQTKQIFALKQLTKSHIKSQRMIPQIKNEIKIMYSLDHPNIIKLFSHFEENDYIYLIIEFAEGGQLWEKLNRRGRFDEKTVQQYMREMISAIEYCHSRKPPIIHRDIKPENILLDKEGKIKLADFGWSNVFNPGSQRKTYCGTLDYLAPEMILESGHDQKLDIWSLGVLIFELLVGKAPFTPPSNIKDPNKMQAILEDNILHVKIDYTKDFPPLAKDLVAKLLKKNPQQRLTTKEMKDHPWLKLPDSPVSLASSLGNIPSVSSNNQSNQNNSSSSNDIGVMTPKAQNDNKNQQKNLNIDVPNSPASTGAQVNNIQTPSKQQMNNPISSNHDADKKNQIQNEEDGFTTEELKAYSKRPTISGTIKEDASPAKKPTETDKLYDAYKKYSIKNKEVDSKQQIIDELNEKIKQMAKTINESEVQLKLKNNEIISLKKELEKFKIENSNFMFDSSGKPLNLESKKIKLLEEEKNKLKKEFDDVWKALEEKENMIQQLQNEMKKIGDVKKQADKYKQEKSNLSEEVKKLTVQINQLNTALNELKNEKEDDKLKFERQLRDAELRNIEKQQDFNNQIMLKDFFEYTKTSMDAMQKKIDFYKERSENLDQLQNKLNEKEKEIIKLKADHVSEIETIRLKISEKYEDELEKLEKKCQNDIKIINERHCADLEALDKKIEELKEKGKNSESNDFYINALKQQKDVAEKMINDMKTQLADLQNINKADKETIRELRSKIEDYKMSQEVLKKNYKKP